MVKSFINHAILLALLLTSAANASLKLTAELDTRYAYDEEHDLNVDAFNLSLRKTISDNKGDRLIFSALGALEENGEEIGLHEAYLRYKGPMGKWNITAGKFLLPYGIRYGYSAERMLFETVEDVTVGMESAWGLKFSGLTRHYDYVLTFTDNNGNDKLDDVPHNGLFTGRLGFEVGLEGDLNIGVSALSNYVSGKKDLENKPLKNLLALDVTYYWNSAIIRGELNGGVVDEERLIATFINMDYALLRNVELNSAFTITDQQDSLSETLYLGVNWTLKYCAIRGGYHYARNEQTTDSKLLLQVYSSFTHNF